jgi:hypothetical protein
MIIWVAGREWAAPEWIRVLIWELVQVRVVQAWADIVKSVSVH